MNLQAPGGDGLPAPLRFTDAALEEVNDAGHTATEGVAVTVDERGITTEGPGPDTVRVLEWVQLSRAVVGEPTAFTDGSPAVTIVAHDGTSHLRWLLRASPEETASLGRWLSVVATPLAPLAPLAPRPAAVEREPVPEPEPAPEPEPPDPAPLADATPAAELPPLPTGDGPKLPPFRPFSTEPMLASQLAAEVPVAATPKAPKPPDPSEPTKQPSNFGRGDAYVAAAAHADEQLVEPEPPAPPLPPGRTRARLPVTRQQQVMIVIALAVVLIIVIIVVIVASSGGGGSPSGFPAPATTLPTVDTSLRQAPVVAAHDLPPGYQVGTAATPPGPANVRWRQALGVCLGVPAARDPLGHPPPSAVVQPSAVFVGSPSPHLTEIESVTDVYRSPATASAEESEVSSPAFGRCVGLAFARTAGSGAATAPSVTHLTLDPGTGVTVVGYDVAIPATASSARIDVNFVDVIGARAAARVVALGLGRTFPTWVTDSAAHGLEKGLAPAG